MIKMGHVENFHDCSLIIDSVRVFGKKSVNENSLEAVFSSVSKTEDKIPSSNTTMRTQCPVGHEPVDLSDSVDCPAVEDVLSENDSSSLWLIKLPHDFDVSSLSGQNVILNGSQDLLYVSEKNKDKRYEIQSKEDSGAELSSFSVVLPSSRKKSLRAVSTLRGQMSVIQSVCVPPSTLPDDSLTVQRRTHNEYIKKWKPFGYRKPPQKLEEKRVKKSSEHLEDGTPGVRKKHKDKISSNLERTAVVENELEEKKKRDSPKRKKKDKERQEIDLSRVKTEPGLDKTRKRKGDENGGSDDDGCGLVPVKQKREKNRESVVGDVMVKRERDESDDVFEGDNDFDLARAKREPGETPKKAKKRKKHKAD